MSRTGSLTEKEERRFVALAKKAGLTVKQIEPEVTLSTESLLHKWKKISFKCVPRNRCVHLRHKGTIVELLLMNIDIFTVSSAFNYNTKTVLRFIENECTDQAWILRKCSICKDLFVAFGRKKICRMPSCQRVKKYRQCQARFLRKIYTDFS